MLARRRAGRGSRSTCRSCGGRVLVAAGFAFAISLGEFGATVVIARADAPTVPDHHRPAPRPARRDQRRAGVRAERGADGAHHRGRAARRSLAPAGRRRGRVGVTPRVEVTGARVAFGSTRRARRRRPRRRAGRGRGRARPERQRQVDPAAGDRRAAAARRRARSPSTASTSPPRRRTERGVGMMFQHHALFPHLDVGANVAFGLRMQGQRGADRRRSGCASCSTLVGLDGTERRDIATLSGGEQQRVALARALAPAPRVLLLDEPLGSLDRPRRERLVVELRALFARLELTVVAVTHDHAEAFALADRLVLLDGGRVLQTGAPPEVWQAPASSRVAELLGFTNLIDVTVDGGPRHERVGRPRPGRRTARRALIRPEAVRLDGDGAARGRRGGRHLRRRPGRLRIEVAGRAAAGGRPARRRPPAGRGQGAGVASTRPGSPCCPNDPQGRVPVGAAWRRTMPPPRRRPRLQFPARHADHLLRAPSPPPRRPGRRPRRRPGRVRRAGAGPGRRQRRDHHDDHDDHHHRAGITVPPVGETTTTTTVPPDPEDPGGGEALPEEPVPVVPDTVPPREPDGGEYAAQAGRIVRQQLHVAEADAVELETTYRAGEGPGGRRSRPSSIELERSVTGLADSERAAVRRVEAARRKFEARAAKAVVRGQVERPRAPGRERRPQRHRGRPDPARVGARGRRRGGARVPRRQGGGERRPRRGRRAARRRPPRARGRSRCASSRPAGRAWPPSSTWPCSRPGPRS